MNLKLETTDRWLLTYKKELNTFHLYISNNKEINIYTFTGGDMGISRFLRDILDKKINVDTEILIQQIFDMTQRMK